MNKTYSIQISGLVQGVGFRPFIFLLASRYRLKGTVENTTEGVHIRIKGSSDTVAKFCKAIRKEAPAASNIEELAIREDGNGSWTDFTIVKSTRFTDEITEVSPDIAVCENCLRDMETQAHRIHYPFINCTHCGPRFTIVRDLPYDRSRTSMDVFPMCTTCETEYKDVYNRRFHAQPVACNNCGPEYNLKYRGQNITGTDEIISRLARMIEAGKIIAIKGLGGFHLACDAGNEKAVEKLRKMKNREGKPFAVMYGSLEELEKKTVIGAAERESLVSWRRPIVLLRNRQGNAVSHEVDRDLGTTGAMLPYMPLHHLLFRELRIPAIVLTSGNLSDEPILISNETAREKFSGKVDVILEYNRDIVNRTDDSVVKIIDGKERVLRRSRGYAPAPVRVNLKTEGILATGAELNNCFCVGKGNMAILSQHIGDVKNLDTFGFFQETAGKFCRLFRFDPTMIVCDMHPDYLTTRFAEELSSEENIGLLKVQHHHAHIASCMAEHRLDETVIGVAMDGTGYGDDGNIWGAEVLTCDLSGYERSSHFEYVPLPGGDLAIEEPWRMGISYLYKIFGDAYRETNIPFVKNLEKKKTDIIEKMIRSKINSPLVSSAGRLFDAVAAILNICPVATFQAEAPMRLESLVRPDVPESYPVLIDDVISFEPMIREIILDLIKKRSSELISTKFHNTVVSAIFETVRKISEKNKLDKVVISGGTFQNRYLVEQLSKNLTKAGFKLYLNEKIPPNDGGIALGQLAIAAKRRSR